MGWVHPRVGLGRVGLGKVTDFVGWVGLRYSRVGLGRDLGGLGWVGSLSAKSHKNARQLIFMLFIIFSCQPLTNSHFSCETIQKSIYSRVNLSRSRSRVD